MNEKFPMVILFCFCFFIMACCLHLAIDNKEDTNNNEQEPVINCSELDSQIWKNWKENKPNFSKNEELIIMGFNNGCQFMPNHDKNSYLAVNASMCNDYYKNIGNYSESIICAKKAIEYANQSKHPAAKSYIPFYTLSIAENYYRLGNYASSKEYCLKTLPLTSSPMSNNGFLYDIHPLELLADNEYNLGEKNDALIHYKKALDSSDFFMNKISKTSVTYAITGNVPEVMLNQHYQLEQKYENLYNELNSQNTFSSELD